MANKTYQSEVTMTNVQKLQILGQFDCYDFTGTKHKIWFKNLNIIPNNNNEDYSFIEKAFINEEDTVNLIGNLEYEEKVMFNTEVLLNENNEYELIHPVTAVKIK